jgi:hypothetical protein
MSIQFGWNGEVIGSPLLVARGLFGVGGETVALDGFHCNARDIFDGEVQDGMFSD